MARSHVERFAVWKAWEGRCFWCWEPVPFKDVHKDHVLPLAAAKRHGGLEKLRELYALPPDFELDDFENWAPSCPSCNQRKGAIYPDPSPSFSVWRGIVVMNGRIARAIAEGIEAERGKAPLLAKIASAVEAGDLTKDEIQEFLRGLPEIIRKAMEIPEKLLQIAPGWLVVQRNGNSTVRPGKAQVANSATKDSSWLCPRCWHDGPWNGNICMTCGTRTFPD